MSKDRQIHADGSTSPAAQKTQMPEIIPIHLSGLLPKATQRPKPKTSGKTMRFRTAATSTKSRRMALGCPGPSSVYNLYKLDTNPSKDGIFGVGCVDPSSLYNRYEVESIPPKMGIFYICMAISAKETVSTTAEMDSLW